MYTTLINSLFVCLIFSCSYKFGRRSINNHSLLVSDIQMSTFGEPIQLRDDVLPTELQIYNHFLYLNNLKCASGDWKHNTDLSMKAKSVREDVGSIWDRSGVPHGLNSKKGKKLIKVALDRMLHCVITQVMRSAPVFLRTR